MSANDNMTIKDGLGNQFKLRSKDISTAQDGSLQRTLIMAQLVPAAEEAGSSYAFASKSGSMAAGLAANSPIYSFRWNSSTLLAMVRRIRISAWSLGTGFTAGIATFDLFRAHSFTVADTGGVTDTLTSNNAALRGSFAATAVGDLRHSSTATLTAGTRSLDAQASDTMTVAVTTATNTPFLTRSELFTRTPGEHPLVLAENEGFIIQATVPATGLWSFAIVPEWCELPIAHF